ncbi:MAG: C10 family peptidase [Bacteroidales bacterium]|nr:C10 family peptidase [Bacteroidales bacterium]
MKKQFLIIIFLIFTISLIAKEVPKSLAQTVAKNYYFQALTSLDKTKSVNFDKIALTCILDPSTITVPAFYVFNINNDEGFVIVSSDDNVKPILAYSFVSGFNIGNISASQQYLLDYYSFINLEASKNKLAKSNDALTEWRELTDFNPQEKYDTKTTVAGLLDPIKWNQGFPYNGMCPVGEGAYQGYDSRCPVGCSAIAMLQIMKYYNWPNAGTGSYTHTSEENGGHGDVTINFGQNTYDWYSMPHEGGQINDELAKMCFHAGVAAKMHWSVEGSGAWPADVAMGLINYFSYKDNIEYLSKEEYSETDWKAILRNEIDLNRPVFYAGYSDEAGHAWNCDGYQGDDHFHMNWGWGGYGNGFYTLDALGTSATPGNSDGNYNQWQHALTNVYPDANFPQYCNGLTFIGGNDGSFGDGSSYENYQNNTACTYIIEPECSKIVYLNFTKFDLAEGDYLKIWAGSPEENNLLAYLDADSLPKSEYESIVGKMTIEFVTNDSLTADGWTVNYKTRNCMSNHIYTDPAGSFDDGSKLCQYRGTTLCNWKIQPENKNTIYIDFEHFDLAEGMDFVDIYKDEIKSQNLIATYNHENVPDQTLIVDAETVIVRFFAPSTSTLGDGWRINYNSEYNNSNVQNTTIKNELSIYPNPGNLNAKLIFDAPNKGSAKVSVYNVIGEIVASETLMLEKGENLIPISKVSGNQKPGIYMLYIDFNGSVYSGSYVFQD